MKRPHTDIPDHALWDEVKRTITPLKLPRPLPSAPGVAVKPVHAGHQAAGLSHSPRMERRQAGHPPPLAAFDRRTAQKLSRGQVEPDARIDLHGHGLEVARMQLYHFLERERRHGSRLVLVITGKGASPFARHTLHGTGFFHAPEREGRLRREVPLWLNEHVFREHVSGLQPAHPRHGGGGAYYLRLRRLPEHD
ncbi:MAG: Smr/MutS family protein [Rhizobiales bacterium]|nr:Smr/MutS family protein [Hyphomicrobiales bacterium]